MYIRIMLGAQDVVEFIVNPDCMAINFTLYVKQKLAEHGIRLAPDEWLELTHMEDGIVNLRRLNHRASVADIVQHTDTYYPVLVKTDANDDVIEHRVLASRDTIPWLGSHANFSWLMRRLTETLDPKIRTSLSPTAPRIDDQSSPRYTTPSKQPPVKQTSTKQSTATSPRSTKIANAARKLKSRR